MKHVWIHNAVDWPLAKWISKCSRRMYIPGLLSKDRNVGRISCVIRYLKDSFRKMDGSHKVNNIMHHNCSVPCFGILISAYATSSFVFQQILIPVSFLLERLLSNPLAWQSCKAVVDQWVLQTFLGCYTEFTCK